jgi:hypothetical protein
MIFSITTLSKMTSSLTTNKMSHFALCQSFVKLSFIYAECHYADCHNAERNYAESSYAHCHYAGCHYADCHYAECHYAECHYAESYCECHYSECGGAILSPVNFVFTTILCKQDFTLILKVRLHVRFRSVNAFYEAFLGG